MRLFVCIRPPDAVVEELCQLQWGVRGLRWTDPDQLHLTLRFSEWAARPALLIARLQQLACQPFELTLRGVGHFSMGGGSGVLWVGVNTSAQLLELQRRVEAEVRAAGEAPVVRRFVPHVTVGRGAKVADDDIGAFLVRHALFRGEARWSVEDMEVVRSRPHPGGAEHDVLERIHFAAGGLAAS